MTALEARGLVRRYGRVVAVGGVDVQVARGEVVGLLGPNGAGKSTAFRLLAGLETPDEGRVVLDGRDVTSWPLHRRARAGLAWLPQHPSVLPRLSVADNLALVRGADVPRLLEDSDLAHLAERPAGALSGGERRRLEIARCVALAPVVAVLDEPFAGVDPAHVREVQQRVRQMARDGIAVLLTDHAVREALRICDRAIVIDGGTVQIAGSPEQVVSDPRARERYFGTDLAKDFDTRPLHGS